MWPLSTNLLAIVDVKKGVGGIFFGEEQCLYMGIILVLCRKQTPLTKHQSTMPRPPTLRLGEGATCSVLLKFLRPSREVSEKFPNAVPTQRLDDLVAVRFAVVTRGRSSYPAIFFTSPIFPGIQLQAAKKKVKVLQEGHPGSYWGDVPDVPFELPPALQDPVDARDTIFDDDVFFARNNAEDIARPLRGAGME